MSDTILGQKPLEGGLRLMRLTAAIPVGAVLGGLLVRWTDLRVPTVLGLALSAAGFYLLSTWDLGISDPAMTTHLAVGGLGFGLVIAPLGTAVMDSVKEGDRGTAAALLTVMRMVGMMVGLSAMAWWGMGRFQTLAGGISLSPLDGAPGSAQIEEQLTGATLTLFQDLFLAAMAICLVALLPAVGLRRQKRAIG
jgi:hypothetical protein